MYVSGAASRLLELRWRCCAPFSFFCIYIKHILYIITKIIRNSAMASANETDAEPKAALKGRYSRHVTQRNSTRGSETICPLTSRRGPGRAGTRWVRRSANSASRRV